MNQKNWLKEMAPSFFGNVFLLRVFYMFRTENGQVLIFSNYPTMAEQEKRFKKGRCLFFGRRWKHRAFLCCKT